MKLTGESFSQYYPYSIHHMLNSKRGLAYLTNTLMYNFSDVPIQHIEDWLNALKQVFKTNEKAVIHDGDYLKIIFEKYLQTDKSQKKYALTFEQFLDQKAKKIADLIYQSLKLSNAKHIFSKQSPKEKLLDIGTGDGNMSYLVGQKLNLVTTGVDITETGDIEWSGESGQSHLKDINLVFYDGKNLKEALKKDTDNYQNLYTVIMFNHSLHHYPTFAAQIDGLMQAISLLKEGGVLFLSEHGNILFNHQLHLQHILFDIKTKLDLTINKGNHAMDEVSRLIANYKKRKENENYFSRPILTKILTALGGLQLVETAVRVQGFDPSQTIFYCFRKPVTKRLSKEPLTHDEIKSVPEEISSAKQVKTLSAFEAHDVDQFHVQQLQDEHSIPDKKRTLLTQLSYSNLKLFAPQQKRLDAKKSNQHILMFDENDENTFIVVNNPKLTALENVSHSIKEKKEKIKIR